MVNSSPNIVESDEKPSLVALRTVNVRRSLYFNLSNSCFQEISYGAQEQLDIKDRITEKLAAGILEKDKLIEVTINRNLFLFSLDTVYNNLP